MVVIEKCCECGARIDDLRSALRCFTFVELYQPSSHLQHQNVPSESGYTVASRTLHLIATGAPKYCNLRPFSNQIISAVLHPTAKSHDTCPTVRAMVQSHNLSLRGESHLSNLTFNTTPRSLLESFHQAKSEGSRHQDGARVYGQDR